MLIDDSKLKVLADTRCADQVIRLTSESVPGLSTQRHVSVPEVYLHEWVHYFQFSGTLSGVILSMVRRECFHKLKRCLSPTVEDTGEDTLQSFLKDLEAFNAAWEAWPRDWHAIGRTGRHTVAEADLRPDGLYAKISETGLRIRLPIGLHAVYEAMAWCTAQAWFVTDGPVAVPKDADSLVYTWPLWVLADQTGRAVDSFDRSELYELLPLLSIACHYDFRLIVDGDIFDATSLGQIRVDLESRDVTVGRTVWQLFRERTRFWSTPLTAANTDAFLMHLGLPALSLMLEQASNLVRQAYDERRQFLEAANEEAKQRGIPLILGDVQAELDLLRTSAENIDTIRVQPDLALSSPLLLVRALVPPSCAIDRPNGYAWMYMTFGNDRNPLALDILEDYDNRVLLRQQLSISEHVLMQMAFGTHLGCYGSRDWKRPINQCPAAAACEAIPAKRGIEFCTDLDWRRVIGTLVPAVLNRADTNPQEDRFPGIERATHEAGSSPTALRELGSPE